MVISLVSGFIGGVAVGSFVPLNVWMFIAVAVLGAAFFFSNKYVSDVEKKALHTTSIFVIGAFFGLLRIYFSDIQALSELHAYEGKDIHAVGTVILEPDVREENTRLTVKLDHLLRGTENVQVNERIQITVPLYPEFEYGDKLLVRTTVVSPSIIEREDGRTFDYIGYLRARGIWYLGRNTDVELLSRGNGGTIKTLLFKTKKLFTRSLSNALPEPESSLLSGLLLGAKQSLGTELLDKFQRVGVSHIVVLSGYNIAIVAESIMKVLSFLPPTVSFGTGIMSIILFTILSGGGASATRAAIMVVVALFAKRYNRDYRASRALGFAIVCMLAPNPLLLAFDPSFQLSILATIGLVFVSPEVSQYITWVSERFGLKEIISTTIATQITVLPYLLYSNGTFSMVSLPVNILILGTIPITMLFGFCTGLFGIIALYLSFIPGLFASILLKYQLYVIALGDSIPFGKIKLPAFSPEVLFLIYFCLLIFFLLLKSRKTT